MTVITVDAVLFDNDGTLIDSTPGVYAAWGTFGKEYGFDGEVAAHETHGRRLIDSLHEWCHLEGQKLEDEVRRFEQEVIDVGPIILPGVKELLDSIKAEESEERPGWTICTSATRWYAPAALAKAGVPLPMHLVTSDDVAKGKPFPDPYLAGAMKCNVKPENCLVVEDAPSGIKSGKAAGSKTLAVCTSHTREAIAAFEPDYLVEDLSRVKARWVGKQIELTLDES
ncbi:HAD-like protein [Sistotremastrum niveocremeum HHB9708]|uniref:HAD-like protein n=2 Tax=Sistotremastraceae TaxID=3402574 RepID=A0A164R8E4_9AGAM|nr:HAD-like protein [Sistotremastrum niveocremeum HHB9708]KZT42772.1 HAD-like protein [Sistotremastrum suecicum HHB10207 ss-3]